MRYQGRSHHTSLQNNETAENNTAPHCQCISVILFLDLPILAKLVCGSPAVCIQPQPNMVTLWWKCKVIGFAVPSRWRIKNDAYFVAPRHKS